MKLTRKLRTIFESITGLRVFKRLPRGVDFSHDLDNSLPGYEISILFDVGANTGQSATKYHKDFPVARIFSFEPVSSTFQQLQRNLKLLPEIRTFQIALGSKKGRASMVKKGSPDMFFVADDSSTGKTTPGVEMEEIDVLPLDAFCEREEISHISFLKIDTEGGDLNVLKGAEKMLSQQRVDFVEVEAGMNCGNKFHVPFETLRGHLEERNYSLFAIYEQVHEWPANEPQLRRANLVFMSRALIASTKVRGQSIV